MLIWEVDFYRRPLQNETGQLLWELLICTPDRRFEFAAFCPQAKANSAWLVEQLQAAIATGGQPDTIRVFRPQTLNLLQQAAPQLGLAVEPNRHTPGLKQWLQERVALYPQWGQPTHQPYQPLELERPAPIPMPENLWGQQWRFAALPAGDLADAFAERLIPYLELPAAHLPLNLGLASNLPIPGVVIDGGRRSLLLAQWLQKSQPVSLSAISGQPDGLILEAGLVDRWVVATFTDPEVAKASREFEQRKQAAQGLHFLLVQPDDSGMTYTGFWLLRWAG